MFSATLVSIGLFILFMFTGAPVFIAMSFASFVANEFFLSVPGTIFPQTYFASVNNWTLLAVPFFLFSGNLMAKAGLAKTMFDLSDKLVGHIRGGFPTAVVLASCLFGSLTGSGVATALAIGAIAIPELLKRGYSREFSFGLVATSGMVGLMIPPSVYMILFAGLSLGSVIHYFTAGYLPGFLIAACLIAMAVFLSKKEQLSAPFSWKERRAALIKALPALSMPVFIMGSIYGGIFTATESSALSVVYTLFIMKFFFKENFNFKVIFDSAKEAATATAQIYIILGAVTAFSAVLMMLQVPQTIGRVILHYDLSPNMLLIAICIIYFLVSMPLDAVPVMYLLVPIFLPVTRAAGINDIHFMILTVTMMMISLTTPPFGMVVFALSGTLKEKIEVIFVGAMPFIIAMLVAALLLIFFPAISTFLPSLLL